MKKILIATAAAFMLTLPIAACAEDFSWADTEVAYCRANNIMNGDENGDLNLGGTLTRAEMAKMLTESFGLSNSGGSFSDVAYGAWYYDYAGAIKSCMTAPDDMFKPNEKVSREEFAATLVRACGIRESALNNSRILDDNFSDAYEVSPKYKNLLSIAVEKAYYRGSDYMLRPQDSLKRVEVCALLYRVRESRNGNITLTWEDLGVPEKRTPIIGEAQVSMESAINWAKAHGCSDLFVDAAQYYWKYGDITGIRPEVLYAQAAKETGYGKYGGKVKPEMNNFAGIKTYGATGDETYDHETFATREDGVRGHFNHMSAYVGLAPIGEVHERYKSVSSMPWAGTIDCVEALGGRWCPDLYYGYAIVSGLINEMYNY